MSQVVASSYEIVEEIGHGGGGDVYLAYHLRLGKKVVLKADRRKISTDPRLLRREVDTLKELSHTYIPQVYDFFIENNTVYTVIDYIEGESLDKPLERGEHFSQAQVIAWAIQILEALCYLHAPVHGEAQKGFVHSDIKPANIMRKPNQDVCLIDFNIALALGEENAIGRSAGYASPEHYGLDFSTGGYQEPDKGVTGLFRKRKKNAGDTKYEKSKTATESNVRSSGWTEKIETQPSSVSGKSTGTSGIKMVVPDVRSDLYSLGATLYHLLSGQRPAKSAKEVVPLSEKKLSPQVIKIISKAMNPNPDMRYQTAEEMLYAFTHLRENDPRVKRLKRSRLIVCPSLAVVLAFSVGTAFVGLKRMQTTEQWLKLAEYSRNALAEGDGESAVRYALQALPEQSGLLIPPYTAQAQKALADALGVYDLSDSFKTHKTVELPAAPFCMAIAPDGSTAACIYAYSMAVFDTDTADIIATFPAEESALAEVVYLNRDIVVFAGKDGVTAYDIEKRTVLWTGKSATSITVSGDGKSVAAVYKEESFATVYDAADGKVKATVDFQGRHQQVTVNDRFANPRDNLLALNNDGTWLGVSFADGSLEIYGLGDVENDTGNYGLSNLENDRKDYEPGNSENNMEIFNNSSGYTHFEGGFYQHYFVCTASDESNSVFAVLDLDDGKQTGGFQSSSGFSVETDESGIYVQTENLLVKLHPVTGDQTPLVTTAENIRRFARSDTHTLITTEKEFLFFDQNAMETARHQKEYDSDFIRIANGTALIGSMDMPSIRIMKYENHPETELLAYDTAYDHDEARVSGDGETVMLFSYERFYLYGKNGTYLEEVSIPEPEQVYDQQYIRDEDGSRLEVIYYDGKVLAYDARDGKLLYEKSGEAPDPGLQETFYTDKLRIESPLHGTPAAYDKNSGKLVRELEQDAYLTYVTQAGKYIVVQYVTADGYCYGQLLDGKCEVLAELPYLCDVIGARLIFDYPTGDLRETRIYEVEELKGMAGD